MHLADIATLSGIIGFFVVLITFFDNELDIDNPSRFLILMALIGIVGVIVCAIVLGLAILFFVGCEKASETSIAKWWTSPIFKKE